jgi:hypothetical protein
MMTTSLFSLERGEEVFSKARLPAEFAKGVAFSLAGAKEYFNRLWCLAHEVAPRYVTLPIPNCT